MELLSNGIQALIFDMDGTIVQTSKNVWRDAILSSLIQLGVCPDRVAQDSAEIEDLTTGIDLKAMAHFLCKRYDSPALQVQAFKDTIFSILHNQDLSDLQFVSGFSEFALQARSLNIPMAVATNSGRNFFAKIQAQMDLPKYFGSHLYCIDDVLGVGKPNPTIFLHAAEKLNIAPEKCVVFEDSYPGFLAAKAAGMKVVAISNELNQKIIHMANGKISCYSEAFSTLKNLLD